MKLSPNTPCPCHSKKKYKQCCQPYHKGVIPKTALLLMRSRYSAYALGLTEYIMRTTHSENPDFTDDTSEWKSNINAFVQNTAFSGLKIMEFIDGKSLAYVTFEALLNNQPLKEKSRFLKVNGKWLYERGSFD